jgi:hypothetical protein
MASLRTFRLLWVIMLFPSWVISVQAQIQQAWVAKYNNGITNGNHQALKITLDSTGNIYVLGVSANANTNTGYVVLKYAPNGNQMWVARYDSTNFPTATPTGFALDNSNNTVVTGSAMTVKFAADGDQLWAVPYNGQAIVIDPSGNPYITGVSNTFTTVKLTSTGSNVWNGTWTYQGLANVSQVIAIDSFTNIYVAGQEQAQNPLHYYVADIGTVKYNQNGHQLWETNYSIGPDNGVQVVGLSIDKAENVFLEANFFPGFSTGSCYLTLKYDVNGMGGAFAYNPTTDAASLARSLNLDNLGNIILTGGNAYYYPNFCYGTYKLNTNGQYISTNLYPNVVTGNSQATSTALDQVGSIYVSGYSPSLGTNGDSDIVTIKYDSKGNQVWLQRYNGPGHGNDAGNAITVDNSGNVYVAGYETEANGFTSMILIKYSPVTLESQSNGNITLRTYGSSGETFDIQASTNLQNWQDLGPITADTNGIVLFEDTNALQFPARFYSAIPK